MSSNIAFVFTSAPSSSFKLETEMPCYECSSPASKFPFSFEFKSPLIIMLPALETTFTPDYFANAAKQSRRDWANLKPTEGSTKTSRFNWSEMDFPTGESAFENFTEDHEDVYSPLSNTYSSISGAESEFYDINFQSNCPVCSMVPYGAVCTNCDKIQTSKAMVFATPPAATWPIVDRLGDWEGTSKLEEELLQNLDMELFEQINVPHELDEWGRRIYNDCGPRIIYCLDEDGNTVMGYEAWYPSSVTGDYEEPDGWRTGRQPEDPAIEMETGHQDHDECGQRFLYSADSDEDTIVGVSEGWYQMSLAGEYEEPTATQYNIPMVDFEQRRLAEFLAAQDEDLPQFQSDRERVAAWIAASSVAEDQRVY